MALQVLRLGVLPSYLSNTLTKNVRSALVKRKPPSEGLNSNEP